MEEAAKKLEATLAVPQSQDVPLGWKLVPEKPTKEMREVLEDAACFDEGGYLGLDDAEDTYAKLLSLSPKPPRTSYQLDEAMVERAVRAYCKGIGKDPDALCNWSAETTNFAYEEPIIRVALQAALVQE